MLKNSHPVYSTVKISSSFNLHIYGSSGSSSANFRLSLVTNKHNLLVPVHNNTNTTTNNNGDDDDDGDINNNNL
jgi:hypothetical protein